MSIQTELTRLTNAKAAIQTAIEGKGVTVPEATLLDGMASLIDSIEAGGGGVRVEQGSVTFAEAQNSYTFVADTPDIFIAYVEDDSRPVYSSAKYVWMIIQDTRFSGSSHVGEKNTSYIFGHNQGSGKYYVPYRMGISTIGVFRTTDFNGCLGAKTYKWYAIYGVTAT